jgi:hypothetical protein
LARRLESAGEESCPAGLGLTRTDGQFLHICPDGATATVHWRRPVRVFGILSRPRVDTWEEVSLSRLPRVIRDFYGDRDIELELTG